MMREVGLSALFTEFNYGSYYEKAEFSFLPSYFITLYSIQLY